MHMNTAIKKFLAMMPVIVLGIFYLHDHYSAFTRHLGAGRVMLMWLSFFLFELAVGRSDMSVEDFSAN